MVAVLISSFDATIYSDADGLSNLQEYLNGTEPYSNDSDWDSMPDSWEVQYGLNPILSSDAWDDPDGDGVVNRDEYIQGTNPI